jgi:amino acid transporter
VDRGDDDDLLIGIELSARTQVVLLGFEIVTLAIFAVVALVKVASGDAAPTSIDPSISWLNPFEISSFSALTGGILIAIFIYWGWDSAVTVNEETQDAHSTPGRAAVTSTVLLLLIYVVVAVAAQAYVGVDALVKNQDDVLSFLGKDVFGSPLDKILIIAVLTSAAASTQTTILPTARTTLSMARAKALPRALGHVSPRYMTPTTSTVLMGAFSVAWYVGLTIVSENILFDSIAALGLMIAFYYGLTGYACVVYYRRQLLRNAKTFLMIGVVPLIGALILTAVFIKSCVDLSDPANSESGDSWFGLGPPLIIGLGFLVFGVILMIIWYLTGHREFFRRRAELAPPESVAG